MRGVCCWCDQSPLPPCDAVSLVDRIRGRESDCRDDCQSCASSLSNHGASHIAKLTNHFASVINRRAMKVRVPRSQHGLKPGDSRFELPKFIATVSLILYLDRIRNLFDLESLHLTCFAVPKIKNAPVTKASQFCGSVDGGFNFFAVVPRLR
jgi:hypothetical protein